MRRIAKASYAARNQLDCILARGRRAATEGKEAAVAGRTTAPVRKATIVADKTAMTFAKVQAAAAAQSHSASIFGAITDVAIRVASTSTITSITSITGYGVRSWERTTSAFTDLCSGQWGLPLGCLSGRGAAQSCCSLQLSRSHRSLCLAGSACPGSAASSSLASCASATFAARPSASAYLCPTGRAPTARGASRSAASYRRGSHLTPHIRNPVCRNISKLSYIGHCFSWVIPKARSDAPYSALTGANGRQGGSTWGSAYPCYSARATTYTRPYSA